MATSRTTKAGTTKARRDPSDPDAMPPWGIAAAPDAIAGIAGEWGALFSSGIVVSAVVAIVLNLVLPGRPVPAPGVPSPAEPFVAAEEERTER